MSLASNDEQAGIAIIGLWCRVPGADSPNRFWANLCDGKESISTLSRDDLLAAGVSPALLDAPSYVKRKGLLDGADEFDAAFFGVTPAEAELTDPQHRQFLECSWLALDNAGYGVRDAEMRVGVFAAQSHSNYRGACNEAEGQSSVRAFQADVLNAMGHLAANVAYRLDLRGPALTIQTACSSSLVAVHLACQALQGQDCDLALAGGVSICWPQIAGHMHVADGIMSKDGQCRPFDADASGTVRGEGVGVVVLRRLGDALRARDSLRAVIKGTAVANDGKLRLGYTAPGVAGQADVIRRAMKRAECPSGWSGYVEAHGTATSLGDSVELSALREALGPKGDGPRWLGAVKANIGHLDAASGVVALIKATRVVSEGLVPPLLHFTRFDMDAAADGAFVDVPTTLTRWRPPGRRSAGVSSFGLGGTNAHVVVQEAVPVESGPSLRTSQLVLLTGETREALVGLAAEVLRELEVQPVRSLADLAYTLAVGRKHGPWRAVLSVASLDELRAILATGVEPCAVSSSPISPVLQLESCDCTAVPWVAALYRNERVFRDLFDACAGMIETALGLDPRVTLVEPEKQAFGPADLFCAQVALGRTLLFWGLRPEAVTGVGVGECAAACVAGALSIEDGAALVRAWESEGPPDKRARCVADAVTDLAPRPADLVWISSVTGKSVGSGEVGDTRRWMDAVLQRSRRDSVRAERPLVVEIGSDLGLRGQAVGHESTVSAANNSAQASFLALLGKAWAVGVSIDWCAFYAGELRTRVSLPSQPLARRRYAPTLAPEHDVPSPVERVHSDPTLSGRMQAGTALSPKATEMLVVGLIEDVLGVSGVQANDDFFDLGGCSLTSIDLSSRIREATGCTISLRELLDAPTASKIAAALRSANGPAQHQATEARLCATTTIQPLVSGLATRDPSEVGRPSFSVFFFAGEAPDTASEDIYRLVLDAARFADAHGLEAIWMPERHFHRFGGLFPSPSVLAAALAMVTQRIAIRAGSVVLPLHRTLEIVEQWSVVDNLSGGRVGMSVAPGFHPVDFVLDPGAYADRRAVYWSQVESLRSLWRGEPLAGSDGLGRPTRVFALPRPLQSDLPLWITASESEESFERAGEMGANVLTALLALDRVTLAKRIEIYRRALTRAHPFQRGRVTVMVHTFVNRDPTIVERVGHTALRRYLDTHLDFAAPRAEYERISALPPDDRAALVEHAASRYTHGRSLIGTLSECEAVATALAASGADEIACLIDFGVGRVDAMQSLAEIVALQKTVRSRVAKEGNV